MAKKKINYSARFNKKEEKSVVSNTLRPEQKEKYIEQTEEKPVVTLSRQIENLWAIKDLKSIFIFVIFAVIVIGGVYFLNDKSEFLEKISGKILNFID